MSNYIEVWYDETSDSDNPVYCVSLCDADGEEIICLATSLDKDRAMAKGQRAADRRGLEMIER